MIEIKSIRAKKLLENLSSIQLVPSAKMKRFTSKEVMLWVELEMDKNVVKKLSFSGELSESQKLLLEVMSLLSTGKALSHLSSLTLREVEAYLRDKNSLLAIEGLGDAEENWIKELVAWILKWPAQILSANYLYPSEKGAFRQLKLADKIKELKQFLTSPEVLSLYESSTPPILVDVDDLMIFVAAPYGPQDERDRFEKLHFLGIKVFSEAELNFIPEPY